MAELITETCAECGQIVIVVLAEPDERPARFNPTPRRMWQIIKVTESHSYAVAKEVHEIHMATCKAINRTE